MLAMDRNPMLQGMMNPIMSVGVIPGKVQLDWTYIKEAMANADDPGTAQFCIPGGAKDQNHDAMPGDISFGLKNVRNPEMMEGEPNELGIVSLSGLNTRMYSCARSIEDQFYFQGFVATPCRVSGHHIDEGTNDPDHGYATVLVGTCNSINNGPLTFFPGSYITTRAPPIKSLTPYAPNNGEEFEGPINQRARMGTPNTQFKMEMVPFDYMDFTLHLAAAYATMRDNQSSSFSPGISDMPFSDFFKTDHIGEVPSFSCEAEEGGGHKYGSMAKVLAGVETLVQQGVLQFVPRGQRNPLDRQNSIAASEDVAQLSEDMGLWRVTQDADGENLLFLKIFANMHFMDLLEDNGNVKMAKENFNAAFGNPNEVGRKRLFGNNARENYKKLRVHASKFTEGHLAGNWYSKTSKIVGRSLNAAAPGDTMHVLAGHFTL